ncbi:hypothetical protein BDW71DRAFT_177034 [Aspergillus fruticulosus]
MEDQHPITIGVDFGSTSTSVACAVHTLQSRQIRVLSQWAEAEMRSIIQVSQAVQIPSVTMLMISRSSRTGLDQFITANDILKPGTLVAADFKYSLFPPKDVPQGSKCPLLLYAKTVEDITVDFLGHCIHRAGVVYFGHLKPLYNTRTPTRTATGDSILKAVSLLLPVAGILLKQLPTP